MCFIISFVAFEKLLKELFAGEESGEMEIFTVCPVLLQRRDSKRKEKWLWLQKEVL